jgi:hypothetical protein
MVGKRYAIADLHGQLSLFNKVKESINDNDIVYALGDFGDVAMSHGGPSKRF